MKRVLIAIAAAAATGIAAGAVHAQSQDKGPQAECAEHKHEKHAERHQRMADRHARHGERRHGAADKPAAPAGQKPEEHKH